MELMDASMDKLYQLVHKTLNWQIPERIIGKITVAVSGKIWSLDHCCTQVLFRCSMPFII